MRLPSTWTRRSTAPTAMALLALLLGATTACTTGGAVAPSGAGATPVGPSGGAWPREFAEGDRTFTVYQPQIEEYDEPRVRARAAVSIERPGSTIQHFGVVWFSARAEVDKTNRLVALDDFTIDRVSFPGEPERAADYQGILQRHLPQSAQTLSLDRLQAALAITQAQSASLRPQPVKNDPPRIIVSTVPALLVLLDGQPVLRPVEGSSVLRVVNTRALILQDRSGGKYYLRVLGRWMEAASLDGPWAPASAPPAALEAAMKGIVKTQRVDTLDDPGRGLKEAAGRGVLPVIHVSTTPAELIQTEGRPDYEPIEGTQLLHVRNSTATIVVDSTDQRHYVLISGRWFRSKSLTDGPWEYVAHDALPADFAKIPESHPRGAALASVAGTPQAWEALIDNNIPQTAEVSRTATTFRATYEGAPRFESVEGTPLQSAVNSPVPVIQVDAKTYYALEDGVWFTGASPNGPWSVATSVPAVIYTIPPSSPLHYVTYVRVYNATAQNVTVGYTPGYYGTAVAPTNVVVYGTGYVYPPVYVGSYWYPPPYTYGYGSGFGWGAFTGFAFGAGVGAVWGGAWGCCDYDDVDIDRNININRNNVYDRWNQGQVRSNLESRAQNLTPQQRQQVQQRAQGSRQAQQALQGSGNAHQRRVRRPRRERVSPWRGRLGAQFRPGMGSGGPRKRARIGGRSEPRAASSFGRSVTRKLPRAAGRQRRRVGRRHAERRRWRARRRRRRPGRWRARRRTTLTASGVDDASHGSRHPARRDPRHRGRRRRIHLCLRPGLVLSDR